MSKNEERALLSEQGKSRIHNCIDIIKRTSIAVISLLEKDEENEFVNNLEYTAENLIRHHNIEEKVMLDYKDAIQTARQDEVQTVNVNCNEVETVRRAIFEMCDKLKNPQEIMRHMRTAFDIIAMWEPCVA